MQQVIAKMDRASPNCVVAWVSYSGAGWVPGQEPSVAEQAVIKTVSARIRLFEAWIRQLIPTKTPAKFPDDVEGTRDFVAKYLRQFHGDIFASNDRRGDMIWKTIAVTFASPELAQEARFVADLLGLDMKGPVSA